MMSAAKLRACTIVAVLLASAGACAGGGSSTRVAQFSLDARRSRITPARETGALGAADVRVALLPAGSTYDPRTGEATLPPR